MARPKGDLGALVVSKATAAAAVPHAAQPAPASVPPADHTQAASSDAKVRALTVKLRQPEYQRLRQLCANREAATGERVSHQEVMLEALLRLLDAEK